MCLRVAAWLCVWILRLNFGTLLSHYRHNGPLIGGETRRLAGKVKAQPCRISPVNIFLGGDSLTQIEPSLHGLTRLVSGGGAAVGPGARRIRWHFREPTRGWPFEETSHREAGSLISPLRPGVSQLTVLLDFTPQVQQIMWKDTI